MKFTTIKRGEEMSLLTRLMAHRAAGKPVLPRSLVTYRTFTGGLTTVKVTSVSEIKGRQGFDGYTMNPETGADYRDEAGNRSKSWGYHSQIVSVDNTRVDRHIARNVKD